MSECMQFPDTWEEFEQLYGFTDKEEVYTNGSRLMQAFRVKQWLDHIAEPERKKGKWLEKQVVEGVDPDIPEWQVSKCSVCGKYLTTPYLYYFDEHKYCPNCGAKLDWSDDE